LLLAKVITANIHEDREAKLRGNARKYALRGSITTEI
jgi:hypothetical protein